jgi:leucyl aminopeptidase
VAFPCISTGIFGYPRAAACDIAVTTVAEWLATHDHPKRVVFCCFGDTDAEGRVLLADALAYLCERKPAAILDSATLTDGSGLGPEFSAAMGTDPELVAEVIASGHEAGEESWEIPLWDRYRPLIDSPVADVKNVGEHNFDSAMMAGLFLKDFVDGVPWVHLDTGSSAYAEHDGDVWPEGGTGAPTRTFIRFLERRSPGRSSARARSSRR